MPIVRRNGTIPLLIVGPPIFVIGFKLLKDVNVSNDYFTYSSSVPADTRIVLLEFSSKTAGLEYHPKPCAKTDRIIRVTINSDLTLPQQYVLLLELVEELLSETKGDVTDDWY